jgi:hypothetical protein
VKWRYYVNQSRHREEGNLGITWAAVSNVISMKRLRWRWTLAFLQVAAAVAALLYAPTQYRSGRHAIFDDAGLRIWRATYPPPVTRIAYSMSFPALAATIPLRFAPSWVSPKFEVYREQPLIVLDTDDFVFFAAVGVFWYWIGAKADRYFAAHQRSERSKTVNVGLAATGFLLSVGVGVLATYYTMLTNADKPFRQIGPFGLVWSAMLLVYFSWNLVCPCKASAPHHA